MNTQHQSIYEFIDFRIFLTAYYRWRKENIRGYSHRLMASSLGFSSPNFLKLVMDGKRNISKEAIRKIAKGLGLNKQETEYFSYLVFFCQAKNNVDKNYYFGLIASQRANKNVVLIEQDKLEFFREWYHPAIREIVKGKKDPLDYEFLSRILSKKVTPAKIKKSMQLLKRLDLVRINAENSYEHSSPLLNTKNEVQPFAVRRYHKQILSIAQNALDEFPPEQREISHVTITISEKGFEQIKQRIQEFRDEILQMASTDHDVSGVYHVNFQLYPIAKGNKDAKQPQ